jgi:hypothetical protein
LAGEAINDFCALERRGINKPLLLVLMSNMADASGFAPVSLIPTFWDINGLLNSKRNKGRAIFWSNDLFILSIIWDANIR